MSDQGKQLIAMGGTPTNCITVDVEDYFHTEAMAGTVRQDQWDQYPSRVEHNTRRLFELFQAHGVRATFFFLGWVAEKFPGLVREAVQLGHEIACHSYWHRLVYRLTAEQFREDTERAKSAIEEAAGRRVLGYRAPCFSMVSGTEWAIDILGDLGFCYDSSVFPIKHDLYSNDSALRIPHLIAGGRLIEFPVATLAVAGHNFPVGGGGYFRILPYAYARWGLRRLNGTENLRAVMYIHPWELDPEQPHLAAPARSRFRQYTGLRTTARKLERLLQDFRFAPVMETFSGELRSTLSDTADLVDREMEQQSALLYEQIGTQ